VESPQLTDRTSAGNDPPELVFVTRASFVTNASASVVIYTRDYCFYCDSAKELLRRKGVDFAEINVTGNRELRAEMVDRANGRTTVPQIFVGTTHVGGCDDLHALEQEGRLDALLKPEETRT
jgi:glutaredoxin 3